MKAPASRLLAIALAGAFVSGVLRPAAQAQTLPAGFSDALVMAGWSSPVGATWDANGRMYVWEKRGRVWIVENGVRLPNPLINIDQEVGNWGDLGMLGFALDPNFLSNGRIYCMYAVDRHHLLYFGTPNYDQFASEPNAACIVRITRYTAIGPTYTSVDPSSRLVLLGETISTGAPLTFNTHGPGTLLFARDGTLLASIGDGASAGSVDAGNAPETYAVQAMADGIMRAEENVGAFRSQMVNSFSGKVLRMDPNTGNGVPSNPYFDASAPRAPRSLVWALGLRNPYRMSLVPGTGSTNPADGNVGTLLIGDVGWNYWEELNVCTEGGQNFGWPLFEGLEEHVGYMAALTDNRDQPNPLFNGTSCNWPFFRFQDLLKQDRPTHLNAHPNPCNAAVQVPNTVPKFFHARPSIDWLHGNRSRCGAFSGQNAVTFDLDDAQSPVPGPRFGGFAAIGGPWSAWNGFPEGYRNCSYAGDYAGGWIRRFVHNASGEVTQVQDFASGLGAVNWIGAGPDGCLWYIKYNGAELRRICSTASVNLPPVAVATQNVQYGPGPLLVQFNGAGSSDPEGGPLTYVWNFGNGAANSTAMNPLHFFTAPPGVPTSYTVTLTVSDNTGQSASTTLLVSLNNTPPVVSITNPALGATYPVGVDTTWQLAAQVSDAEHGPGQLSYAWQATLHHNTHEHPGPVVDAVTAPMITSGEGCDGQTYRYRVRLTVTDAAGLSTTAERWVEPRCRAIAPTAIIQASALAGVAPFTVQFDGTGSYDPGSIVAYHWDFGDGTTSTAPAPLKTYTSIGDRTVVLTVTDDDGLTGQAARTVSALSLDPPQCPGPAGGLLRQQWNNIAGTSVADLMNAPSFPSNPSSNSVVTSFQGPTNAANNYGARYRGYIVPPATGNYVFTVTSDDASALYISLNAEARHRRLICSVPGSTLANEFDKYATQVSEPILLEAGRHYYVEALHKEATQTDHFAVWWQTPSNPTRVVVPGSVLMQWQDCPPGLRLRAFLGGAYQPAVGLQRDDLRAQSLVPLNEPYTGLGYGYVGSTGGSITAARRAETGPNAVVDWVVVELRNKNNPAQVVASRSAIVERDGDVVAPDGWARLGFNVPADNYYVAIRHRNHLAVLSAASRRLDANESALDFTLAATPTFGTHAQAVAGNGRTVLWSGDVSRNGQIRYVGDGNDRDPILVAIGGSVPTHSVTGYRLEDVDLNGVVRYVGNGNDRDPILVNIGGSTPTATRMQQLP
jgi:PKD repeat protein/glucose/arabinose dehydrogenase